MEPQDAPPVIEYVIAGSDAEAICGRGFSALRAALLAAQARREADAKGMEIYVSGQDRWRFTLPAHPAYPSLAMDHNINGAADMPTRTACAYGQALEALEFVRQQGFSPDDMRTRTARFEESAP